MNVQRVLLLVFAGFLICATSCLAPARLLVYNAASIYDMKHFPTKTISPPSNTVKSNCLTDLARGSIDIPNINNWVLAEESPQQANLEGFLEETNTTAFIVVRNDSILYESYHNGYQPEKKQIVFSVAKSILTSMLDIAIQDGVIESVEQKVSDFLPSFKEAGKDSIRIKHLLNMNSGLHHDDYKRLYLTGRMYYHPNLDNLMDRMQVKVAPNTEFVYKSMDTQILGRCIEMATNKDIATYIQEELWEPLEMCQDALLTMDSKKSSQARMFGGMAVSSDDLIKFGMLFLNNGVYKDQQIISTKWIQQIKNRNDQNGSAWWGYKNGWWRDTFITNSYLDDNDFFAAGYNGQYVYLDPENNTLIIRLGENKSGVKWSRSLGKLSKVINNQAFDTYFSCVESTKICGEYYSAETDETLYLSCEKADEQKWKMRVYDNDGKKQLSANMKPSCEQSVFNLLKNVRLIFNNECEENSLVFDNNKTEPVKFVKVERPKKMEEAPKYEEACK